MTDVRLYACCITPEIPAMLLILGVGLYLTVRLGVPQLVLLPRALRLFFRRLVSPEKKEGVSKYTLLKNIYRKLFEFFYCFDNQSLSF